MGTIGKSFLIDDILRQEKSLENSNKLSSEIPALISYLQNLMQQPRQCMSMLPRFPKTTNYLNYGSLESDTAKFRKIDQCAESEIRRIRRNRTVFTDYQLSMLERRFQIQKYISSADRVQLAESLDLTQLQVKTWYQNRRMKWKKEVLENGAKVAPTKPKGRPRKNTIPSFSEVQAALKFNQYSFDFCDC
ncbi:hypothetical protein ACOME3_007838 [Neoechinorhynchus agilis]